jgi:hypothetical protein
MRNRFRDGVCLVGLFAVCSFFSGCGKASSAGDEAIAANITEITGTVTLGGKPTHSVEVHFINTKDEKFSGMGLTDPAGKFSMPGLPPGKYQVRLARQAGVSGEPDPKLAAYWDQSPLSAEISSTQTAFSFDVP